MNPTVTVNPNGPSLCWSPLQRTANSALHKSVFPITSTHSAASPRPFDDPSSHDMERASNRLGGGRAGAPANFHGIPASRRAGQFSLGGDSVVCEDESNAVAAAIRLLESHQLLQQATYFTHLK